MRLSLSLTLTLVFAITLLTACNNDSGQQQTRQANTVAQASPAAEVPNDGLRRITVEELRAALDEGRAVVLDVRGTVEYDAKHIKGALFMPLGEVAARASELPRGKLIVTYCACKHEGLSGHAVNELKKQGIEDAGALLGGLDAWVAAGLPTESAGGS